MRVAGIDHNSNSLEYSGELEEWNVSKRREICLLWLIIYQRMHWDWQIFLDHASSESYIHSSNEYKNSKIL